MQDVVVQRYVDAPVEPEPVAARQAPPERPLFAETPEADLLRYGVPPEWLAEVRLATETTVLDLADHLPREASEALLDLAVGVTPSLAPVGGDGDDPFEHPDAQRRFRTVTNVEELERALDAPWEKWTVFLHPAQRESADRDYNGPARISGSAGTGKTIVALHRAVGLARAHPNARVLLTTFSDPLARSLHTKLQRLAGNEPFLGERIDVRSIGDVARRLAKGTGLTVRMAERSDVRDALTTAAKEVSETRFSDGFLLAEWEDVVDAWQLTTWEDYRDVARLGRKTRLPQVQREGLWTVFEKTRTALDVQGLTTTAGLYNALAERYGTGARSPYDFVVVDEAQDVSVAGLRFLAALGRSRPDGLFFAGDLGQRIFQQPFSWKSLGVDIRGRSQTLRINYRTSHQIRARADLLLGPEIADVDGNTEIRRGATSVFNGAEPRLDVFETPEEEAEAVGAWLAARAAEGVRPNEMGVFVRSEDELDRARAAVAAAGLDAETLDERVATVTGRVAVSTMHLAKGLEFRSVAVMACDDEVLPLQSRIEAVTDDSDLADVLETERHLLYVACTRARDHLLVTSVDPPSEFLDDLGAG